MLHIRMLRNRQVVAQWRNMLNVGYRLGGGGRVVDVTPRTL